MSTKVQVVEERRSVYGQPSETFPAIEEMLAILKRLRRRSDIPGEDHALQQILMKLTRREASPENPDHYLDIQGYTAILAELCQGYISGYVAGRDEP